MKRNIKLPIFIFAFYCLSGGLTSSLNSYVSNNSEKNKE